MKFSRPAIAVAAAAVIAAGAVPAVQHVSAAGGRATVLDPAVSAVETTLAAAPTREETAASTTGTMSEQPTTSALSTQNTPTSSTTAAATTATPSTTQRAATPATAPVALEGTAPDKVVSVNPAPTALDRAPVDPNNPLVNGTAGTGDAAGNAAGASAVKPLGDVPQTTKGKDQRWVGILQRNERAWPNAAVRVHSDAMGRDIPVAVFRATDAQGKHVDNAPTIYLLNGAGGSEQDTDWVSQAFDEMFDTYARAGVNVVVPMEGAFSYYVDWAAEPPVNNIFYKGKQMWSTFLADELPDAIEPYLGADRDRRAIAGLSMAATSVLLLAEHNPGLYKAVGSFSGCAATSTPIPNWFVGLTVHRGATGMTPEHIFGEMGSDYNRYNDALVNAAALKGTPLYISTGTGLAAETDMPGYLRERLEKAGYGSAESLATGVANAATLQIEGGAIEGAMNACTHDFLVKAQANGVDVTHAELRPVGTHAWSSWRQDLKLSYDTVFKQALGLK